MPNTPNVSMKTSDQTTSVSPVTGGLNWVAVQTKWGEYFKPRDVSSWPEFQKLFGGLDVSLPDTLQCKLALEGGSRLKVCKVGNKTAGELTAVKATQVEKVKNADNVELFGFEIKIPGKAYNDVIVSVKSASNGDTNSFDIIVGFYPTGEQSQVKSYPNLSITADTLTTFLSSLAQDTFIKPVYKELDVDDIATYIPTTTTVTFSGGTNGTAVSNTDYVEALNLFDEFSGKMALVAIPSQSSNQVNLGILNYVSKRQDIHGVVWLGDSDDPETLKTARTTLGADTRFLYMIGGSEVDYNPFPNPTTEFIEYSPVAGVLAAAAKVWAKKPYQSFAGITKGKRIVYGVKNNYGSPAKADILNDLNNMQINMLINEDGITYIEGNFTSQKNLSQLSYISISNMDLHIKDSVRPIYKKGLEEPLSFKLVRAFFDAVNPFLKDLRDNKEALYSFVYNGDQGVNKVEDLVVNNPDDFGMGKYKVKLGFKAVPSLQEVEIEIILSKPGLSITTNS